MSKREQYDEVLDSYRNGQIKQFTKQLDAIGGYEIADWVDYVVELGYTADLPTMMKAYFRTKYR